MNFYIDKNLEIPIYIQITNQIINAIDKGIIKPGDRLPTQRELSAGLNISRGSIQKAYEELDKKGVIKIVMGSGSFVSEEEVFRVENRKEYAISAIDDLLKKLNSLNFTPAEIQEFIDFRIRERDSSQRMVRIAAIDCNPEALEIFKIQISVMKNVQFKMFILDDIYKYSQPDKVFEDYDLIITTLNHYDELSGILYSIRDRIIKVAVSPASDTIIKLATIPQNISIGIITESKKFEEIIIRHLIKFNIEESRIEHAFYTDTEQIKKFLSTKHFLIIPQSYKLENLASFKEYQDFINSNGIVIEFEYQIERGSLIHIDEQINSFLI